MNRRERYDYQNKKYISQYKSNPVLVLPDEHLKTLDMFPRVNLIEDIQFRKQIPKSFQMYNRVNMPFSEKAVHYKDRVEFTNRMTQDQLQSQELRELKRGLDQNTTEPQEE